MNRKGNIQKRLVILSLVCIFIFAVIAPKAEEKKGKILNTSFPGLASGILTYACLSDLPENILFRTSDLQISLQDIEKEIDKAPENIKADLRKNLFFLLESIGRKLPDKINSVYIEAKENQILSARYNVNSIPIQIIFDKTGKEIYRHNGALTQETLMTKLKDLGAF